MEPEILKGLINGGSSAIIVGILLLVVTPKILALFRELSTTFRAEMSAERDAHRSETESLSRALTTLISATHEQTVEIRELRNDISRDLPNMKGGN